MFKIIFLCFYLKNYVISKTTINFFSRTFFFLLFTLDKVTLLTNILLGNDNESNNKKILKYYGFLVLAVFITYILLFYLQSFLYYYNEFKLKINKTELINLLEKKIFLSKKQIDKISHIIKERRLKILNYKPKVLLFNGATGTGKTYLSKVINFVFTNSMEDDKLIKINGTYFSNFNNEGLEKMMSLFPKDNRKVVILIDEIDKMDLKYLTYLRVIFESGIFEAKDDFARIEKQFSISNAIIILTSNFFANNWYNAEDDLETEKIVNENLENHLGRDFLARIDYIFHFPMIDFTNIELEKVNIILQNLKQDLLNNYYINLEVDEKFVHNFDNKFGIRGFIETCSKLIGEYIINNNLENNNKIINLKITLNENNETNIIEI